MKFAGLALAWSGQLAFDAIVLAMTLWRSLRIRKLGRHALLDVLIRDGQSDRYPDLFPYLIVTEMRARIGFLYFRSVCPHMLVIRVLHPIVLCVLQMLVISLHFW